MGRPKVWMLLGIVLTVGLLAVACGGSDTSKIKNANLEVGDEAPDFRLSDHTGGYIRFSDYREDKNVVLAFYPLAWTPV